MAKKKQNSKAGKKKNTGRTKGKDKGQMPGVRKQDVIAIFCADVHLCLTPPIWRSKEEDWFEAMCRPLSQLDDLAGKYECPVVYAGDIFDKWNAPAELINFAMDHLPKGYAIPGQHDLPNHSMEEIKRSAFWTLVEAGVLTYKKTDRKFPSDDVWIDAYPFGSPIQKCECKEIHRIKIAVAHEYRWVKGHNYEGAPETRQFGSRIAGVDEDRKWLGYDLVVFGDNHDGFLHHIENTKVVNCGSLMRRRSDQENYKPKVWVLTKQLNVLPYELDVSEDVCLPKSKVKDKEDEEMDMTSFFNELEELGGSALDFLYAVKAYMHKHKVGKRVKKIIQELLDD